MILDRFENISMYKSLSANLARAIEVLQRGELSGKEDGRYEIAGSDIYAMVMTYPSKPREQGKWEAHRKYIDIQYIVEGRELMGWQDVKALHVSEPYAQDKDVMFLQGSGTFFEVAAGQFTIFFPHDAHMPSLQVGTSERVKKVVLKVAV